MQCYSQPWPLLMPRTGISATQSTPSRNRFRKRVQPATKMPSPLVKGFSPPFNPTLLFGKIQTANDMVQDDASLTVKRGSRCRLVHFEISAHFLQARSKRFNLLFHARNGRALLLHFVLLLEERLVFLQKFIE